MKKNSYDITRSLKRTIGCTVLLAALLVACGDFNKQIGGPQTQLPPTQKRDSMAILILCDLSTSLDSTSINRISRYAADCIKKMPVGSKAIFFETEENSRKPSMYKFHKERPRRPSDKPRIVKANKAAAKKVSEVILNKYEKARNTIDHKQLRSCIWSNIVSRISWLDKYRDDHCLHMFILSDMLEQCSSTPLRQKISMKKGQFPNIKRRVSQFAKPVLANYQDVTISCITSSDSYNLTKAGFLSANETEELWKLIFKKMGFQGSLEYTSEFPENLSATCHDH